MQKELINFIQTKIVKDPSIVITPETLLFKGKLIDSMNILDIIGFIEAKISRRLTDDEVIMQNFNSPQEILNHFFYDSTK